jgi:hypothetical protein
LAGVLGAVLILGAIRYQASSPPAGTSDTQPGVLQQIEADGTWVIRLSDDDRALHIHLAGTAWRDDAWAGSVFEHLSTLSGRQVLVRVLGEGGGGGRAGVLPAYVYLADGTMINEVLVRGGWLPASGDAAHPLEEWFTRLEGQARRRRAGRWAVGASD